ncbi:putative calcium dependent mitochondrial carrier protein [Thermoascus aurantiacus ATCC 26904]
MAYGESKDERDRRIAKLWETLDARREGQIGFSGLKKGLRKIDHPLKNADNMLRSVMQAVDTNGDGQIQYDEFRVFVDYAEKELWKLFESIDRNRNGEIDKGELRVAFAKAGVTVSNAKLDEFFADVDTNRDGVISYEEWRDFLLFLPAKSSSDLRAVLSYYLATGNLNPEGDVHINEPLQGLGIDHSFPRSFVLAIRNFLYNIFRAPVAQASVARPGRTTPDGRLQLEPTPDIDLISLDDGDFELEWLPVSRIVAIWMSFRYYEQRLTENTPHLGYFLAGGIAGVVSRTATAPFDRLKVYLIAQTGVKNSTARAAKEGAPLQAAGRASRTLIEATKELWRAGGIRSLFAGNGLNVLKVMPESAIKFGAYEASKRAFARLEGHNDPKRLLPASQFLSGGFGGMVAQCFVYPLDTLKFRMQCETVEGGLKGNQLIAATAKKVWQTNGLFGFFRGLPLGLVGVFPYAAIDLTTFEYLKRALLARRARVNHCHEDDVPLSNFSTGAIGAFSGALSASVVYPLNVLRTRLQAQGTVLHPHTYTGIVDVARRTIQKEGVYGLYKGITPTLLKVAPAVSISYVVYENSKRLLGLK